MVPLRQIVRLVASVTGMPLAMGIQFKDGAVQVVAKHGEAKLPDLVPLCTRIAERDGVVVIGDVLTAPNGAGPTCIGMRLPLPHDEGTGLLIGFDYAPRCIEPAMREAFSDLVGLAREALVGGTIGLLGHDDTGPFASLTQMERSHLNLLRAQELAHLGSWEWNAKTEGVIWSDELYRIFGMDPSKETMTFEQFAATIHEKDRDHVVTMINQHRHEKTPYSIVFSIVRPEGWVRIVYNEGTPYFDKNGALLGMYGIAQDITEQWEAQEELLDSRALLASILDSAPDGIMAYKAVRDAQDTIVDFEWLMANNSGARLLSEQPEHLVGQCLIERFPQVKTSGLFDQFVMVSETGTPLHLEEYKGSGNQCYAIHCVKMGDGLVVSFQNITARKATETALQQSEHEYRTLFENATDALILLDPITQHILSVNKQTLAFYGYRREELLNQHYDIISTTKDRVSIIQQIQNEGSLANFKTIHVQKDGTHIDVLVNTSTGRFKGKEVLLCFVRDISAQLQGEHRLQQSLTELAQLTERLQKVREDERTALSRDLHDMLGHGLALLRLEVLRLGDEPLLSPFAERIEEINEQALKLMQDVRQIGSDLRPSLLDTFGLTAALEAQAERFEQHAGISCRFASPPAQLTDTSNASIWSTQIFRMFQEALTNIAKHASATAVKLWLHQLGPVLVLIIEDDGRGFDTSNLIGTDSLGLVGMRERARSLGGNLTVTSARGEGTMIRIRVPMPQAANVASTTDGMMPLAS